MPVDDDFDFYEAKNVHLYVNGVEIGYFRDDDSRTWVNPVEQLTAKRKRQREQWSKVRPTNDWRKRK
ncbi:hypothetical protein IWT140_01725 [Secundilactobacillus pentosiphilus]|uniref:Uncharacterized protein n=1 Tax=Secundilactobacillus pentosiphilus TaxID=1714682 RepID=A0A1Z5IR37_9LACO|nr:hypothetical protein [Secundilactobacillus pentosiphilus]GAX04088.1 hypothetical protein IWT140_01725 [Secundilactobacillus pentosiphilus]